MSEINEKEVLRDKPDNLTDAEWLLFIRGANKYGIDYKGEVSNIINLEVLAKGLDSGTKIEFLSIDLDKYNPEKSKADAKEKKAGSGTSGIKEKEMNSSN